MESTRAEQLREKAREMRQRAARERSADTRLAMETIAKQYDLTADYLEKH